MGIVFSHTVFALFLHYRNRYQGHVDATRHLEQAKLQQEALLPIENVGSLNNLFSVIKGVINAVVQRSVNSVVFLADENGKLHADKEKRVPLPSQGICWETYETQQFHVQSDVGGDPIIEVIKSQCHLIANWSPKTVYCLPVTDEETKTLVALLVIEDSETIEINKLIPVKHKIVGCYRRLCKCQRDSSANYVPANAHNSVPSAAGTWDTKDAILRLCGDLYDQDASRLQLKVIRHLEEQTNAECGFLLLIVPETQELFCQVIGGHILEEEIKFPGQSSVFSIPLESKKPMRTEDVPLDKRKDIENFVGVKLKSLLCVPVKSRNSDSLIALACVVNKKDSDKFTNEDLQFILQCFQYTSTVLTSTIAFQNERKLKIQTQAMLQVARNLFTHLGEFSIMHAKGLMNYPNLSQFIALFKTKVPIPERNTTGSDHNCNGSAQIQKVMIDDAKPDSTEKAKEATDCHNMHIGELCFNDIPKIDIEDMHSPPTERIKKKEASELLQDKTFETCQKSEQCDMARQNLPYSRQNESYYLVHSFSEEPNLDNIHINETENLVNLSNKMSPCTKKKRYFPSPVCSPQDHDSTIKLQDLEMDSVVDKSLCMSDLKDSRICSQNGADKSAEMCFIKQPELMPESADELISPRSSITDALEKSVEMDFLKVPEGQMSPKSFRTAISDVSSPMFSASDSAHCIEEDLEEVKDKLEEFYDTMQSESTHSVKSDHGESAMIVSHEKDMMDLSSKSDYLYRDKNIPNIHASHSDPSLPYPREFKTSSMILENIESKPELNYAFLAESKDSDYFNMGDLGSLKTVVDSSGLISICSVSSIEVIENTDSFSERKGTLQSKSEKESTPVIKTHPKYSDIVFDQADKDRENIRENQSPSTDVVLVTINDLTKLLREIMQEARNLTQAERCSVFLIDKESDELVAKVFDGITTNDSEEQAEIRMPITQGIAGHVATTGNLLNIKDAYSHPLFYRGIDDSTGFRTRNILCFPIKNEKGDVLGVAQLCNKKTGQYFTVFDEDLASAFAVYCCISISHCLMYKKLQDSQHRNRLANELMIYHMQISPEDVEKLIHSDIPSVSKWGDDFDKFPFPPREISDPETPSSTIAMFEDLGFISRWRIRKDTLSRFVLMVKKGYRNPPYHNWTHAFAVAHFCYLCIKNLQLTQYLDDIEMLALLVSCLGHDLDHRGTNNQYQVSSKSVLAALYSSEGSVMERHHFAQTMCIVNTEGCNIFENLSSKDYTAVLDLIRDIILATDLAHHLKILNNLKELAAAGYDVKNLKHHKLLLCLLMTASDLSDQTKPWDNTKHVAALIYREFFSQGDLEKSLGQKPAEMMDRERARIPDLQIGFLDHIALPVYRLLAELFPEAEIVKETVQDNRRHWEKICALIKIRRGGSCEQMSYDQILAMEEEEANAEIENYKLHNKQNGR